VDLDGDGVELISLDASHAQFDLDVDGFAERTGWARGDDGLLAFDRNGNGVIDDNLELFGTGAGHANGFEYLAELDSDGDGVISSDDAAFAQLSIWRDLNEDGRTDAGELRTLVDYGITFIDLDAQAVSGQNEGHFLSHRSSVGFADGGSAIIDDIFFQVDKRISQKLLSDGFEFNFDALLLPLLHGYGDVASTWVALSESEPLRAASKSLVSLLEQGDVAGFVTDFEPFLLDWAGVSDVAPGSRGSYIDARHLAFLEALYGQPFNSGINPAAVNGAALEQQFAELVEKLAARFMAQAPASSLALGTVDSLAEHPLAFLLPLTEGLTPGNFRLGGSLDASFLGALDAIDGGGVSEAAAVAALALTRHDFGYADTGALGAGLAAMALAFDRPDGLAFEIAAAVAGMAALTGGDTADTLTASSTATVMYGGAGDDILNGGTKSDWLIGGTGDDILRGGESGTTYLYGVGDGDDLVIDVSRSTPVDRLVLGAGIAAADVRLIRSASDLDDLTLSFAGGGSVFLDEQGRSNYYGIDFIDFADGSSWSRADLHARWIAMNSTDGDDVIVGFYTDDVISGGLGNDVIEGGTGGSDTITGGAGNDTLRGGEGATTYLYGAGDGDDIVFDSSRSTPVDRLVLGPGIAASDVTLTRSASDPDDVTVSFAGGGSVFLDEQLRSNYYGVDFIDFADGTSWTRSAILDAVLA
jgi:Ca2+-binding RTX toxin-like protein